MWPSHTKRTKPGMNDGGSLVRNAFAPAIVPLPLYSALCVSTIVGGVLMCPGAAVAQTGADGAPAFENRNNGGPVVAILSPSYSDVLKGHVSVLIGVQAQKYTPKTVEMFVDGKSATGGPIALESAPSTGFDWDTTLFTDGPHRLTVRVADTQGFIGQAEVQVYINNGRKRDIKAPTLNWVNVKDGDVLKGQTHVILSAANDFGVKYVFVSINPAATPKRKPALRQYFLNRPPYDILFDTTTVPDGMYVLDALAWDALENEGKAPQRTFGILNNGINPTWASTLEGMRSSSADSAPAAPAAPQRSASNTATTSGNAGQRVADAGGLGSPAKSGATASAPSTSTAPAAAPASGSSKTGAAPAGPQMRELMAMGGAAPTRQAPSVAERTYVAPDADAMTPAFSERNGVVSSRRSAGVSSPRIAAQLSESVPSLATRGVAASKSAPSKTAPAKAAPAKTEAAKAASTTAASTTAVSTRAASAKVTPNVVTPAEATKIAAVERPTVSGKVTTKSTNIADAALSTAGTASESVISGRRNAALDARPEVIAQATAPRFAARENASSTKMNATVAPAESTLSLEIDGGRGNAVPATQVVDHIIPSRIANAGQPEFAHSNSLRLSRLEVAPRAVAPGAVAPRNAAPGNAVPVGAAEAAATVLTNSKPDFTVVDVSAVPDARIAAATSKPSPAAKPVSPSRTTAFAALPVMPQPRHRDKRPAIVVSRASSALPASFVTERDETLEKVASRFGVKPATLAAVNNMKAGSVLPKGTKVQLPKTLLVSYGGKTVESDVSAVMVGSTSAAAFRHLFEAQGGKVNWDAAKRRVTATNGDQKVMLTIGSKTAVVNEQKVMMDLAAFLLSGRTMVPVRLFEKTMQAKVEFEPSTGRLLVSIENHSSTM